MGTLKNISILEVDKYTADSRYVILDVRSGNEYRKFHISGAVNVPYRQIESGETELDRRKTYILYCEHGGVSIMAAKKLYREGYNVINTLGGMALYRK